MKHIQDAEMAFSMAMKLVSTELAQDEDFRDKVWDKCQDEVVHSLVVRYLVSTSDYAPKALYNLHTKLVELVS